MCRVKETVTESRSLQIERNHSTPQDYKRGRGITPFMRHLGILFTRCWQLSHHCFSSLVLTLLFGTCLQVAIYKRTIFAKGGNAGPWTTVGKPEGPLMPCILVGSNCFPRALSLPDPPGRTLVCNTWVLHCSRSKWAAYNPSLFLNTITLTGRITDPSLTLGYIQTQF